MLVLGACSHQQLDAFTGDDGVNTVPTNYKPEIVAAMHAYLNDPTGIRDATIAAPALKPVGDANATRYVVCIKFNPKKNATEYAGMKELAAAFLAGRFDRFIETPRDQCAGATYTPFPELQKLPP
jgi:hypothetical protein